MPGNLRATGDLVEILDDDGNVVATNQMTLEELEALLPTLPGEAEYLVSHMVKELRKLAQGS